MRFYFHPRGSLFFHILAWGAGNQANCGLKVDQRKGKLAPTSDPTVNYATLCAGCLDAARREAAAQEAA